MYTGDLLKPDNVFGYVYMNYFPDTDMWYIGRHKSQEFDWYYIGSGKLIGEGVYRGDIDANNVCSMILDWCVTNSELNEREEFWTRYFNAVDDDRFYNMIEGGYFGGESLDSNPKAVPVRCVETGIVYETKYYACKAVGRNKTSINKALNDPSRTCAGLHWEYVDREAYDRVCDKAYRGGFSKFKGRKRVHSKETIEKIKKSTKETMNMESMKDLIRSRRKPYVVTDEIRERLSKAQRERYKEHPMSQETKDKIGKSNKGRKMSDAQRSHLSEVMTGKKRGPLPEEVKHKIRESNRGKKRTNEQKLKMSEAAKKRFEDPTARKTLVDIGIKAGLDRATKIYCNELNMEFVSMREACRYYNEKSGGKNLNRGSLRKCLNGELDHLGELYIDDKITKLSWKEIAE